MSAEPTNISRGERMFAHRSRAFKGLPTLVCAFALIAFAGCGGESDTSTAGESSPDAASGEDAAVIEDWSSTLREGDVRGAARLFALPSVVQNGGPPLTIETREDAIAFNRALPCGAELISTRPAGDLTRATFRLSDRPGGDCGSGAGARAATLFAIEDGRIVEWRRIPISPGGSAPAGPGESVT